MHKTGIKGFTIVSLLLLVLVLPQFAGAAGPAISNVYVDDITSVSAKIFWTTNTISTGLVRYGTAKPPTQPSATTGPGTTHWVTLTELTPGETYWFQIEATDGSGTHTDTNSGNYYHFTTLAPATYSVTLEPTCGVCAELVDGKFCDQIIEATAIVAAAGTYYICWDAKAAWDESKLTGVVETITAGAPGSYKRTFFLPVAKKGPHDVYLTNAAYTELAKAPFVVNPSATIAPGYGPVGTTVTINVYGYDADKDVRVMFVQGGIQKGDPKLGKTDATWGSWKVEYTVPDTPSGGYTFEIQSKEGTDLWVSWVSKYFKVIPKITATPNPGKVGQTIEIKGTGFGKDEKNIQVTFGGEVRAAGIVANEKGTWTKTITVPPRQAGTYDIDASGTLTRARDVENIRFVLEPGILLEPNQAYIGETIKVSGGGFRPGETGIKVTLGGQVRATVPAADVNGCWQTSFVLPPSPYGGNLVSAQGDITAPVTSTLTVKAKIEGLNPSEGAPGDSVSLTGTGFSGSRKLTVTVGNATVTERLETHSNGNVAISFRVPKGVTPGKQTLKVTDEGGATDSVEFMVVKKVLATPLRISPEDTTLRSGIVTFSWQGITGGGGMTYIVEISKDSGFRSGVMSESAGTELRYTLPKDKALAKGTYYWRVKAIDNYGNESEFSASDYSKFVVSPIPTWVWVVVGIVVLIVLLVVAYRETKFKVTE